MNNWKSIADTFLPSYIQIIYEYLIVKCNWDLSSVEDCLQKLQVTIPESILAKDYLKEGKYPVVSQSKEPIIGFTDCAHLLFSKPLPVIIFGDHTAVVKYIDFPFVIGADGVKVLSPTKLFVPQFFYFLLKGLRIQSGKYARHYKLLRKAKIPCPKTLDFETQKKIVAFFTDFLENRLQAKTYFDSSTETKIVALHKRLSLISAILDERENQLSILSNLRQRILQDATEGKLTANWRKYNPQLITGINHASKLLAKVKEAKSILIKAGSVKQGKKQIPPTRDTILLELPQEWEYPDLDDITQIITDGTHQTPTYVTDGRIFLSAQNVKPFRFIPDPHRYVTESAYQDYTKNVKPEKGDLLVGRVGSKGETAVIDMDLDFAFYVSLGLIKTFKEDTLPEYLSIVMNSPYGYKYASSNMSSLGASAGNLNLGIIRSFPIPLPALNEQRAIVQQVSQLMEHIGVLENQISEQQAKAEALLQSVLSEALMNKILA